MKLYNNDNIIIFDEDHDAIEINLKSYDDKPHIQIEVGWGYNFFSHTNKIKECKSFMDSFGTEKTWFLEIYDRIFKLDLKKLKSENTYGENRLIHICSYWFDGTRFQLKIETELDKNESLPHLRYLKLEDIKETIVD